jgi:hypothetical protein
MCIALSFPNTANQITPDPNTPISFMVLLCIDCDSCLTSSIVVKPALQASKELVLYGERGKRNGGRERRRGKGDAIGWLPVSWAPSTCCHQLETPSWSCRPRSEHDGKDLDLRESSEPAQPTTKIPHQHAGRCRRLSMLAAGANPMERTGSCCL